MSDLKFKKTWIIQNVQISKQSLVRETLQTLLRLLQLAVFRTSADNNRRQYRLIISYLKLKQENARKYAKLYCLSVNKTT